MCLYKLGCVIPGSQAAEVHSVHVGYQQFQLVITCFQGQDNEQYAISLTLAQFLYQPMKYGFSLLIYKSLET